MYFQPQSCVSCKEQRSFVLDSFCFTAMRMIIIKPHKNILIWINTSGKISRKDEEKETQKWIMKVYFLFFDNQFFFLCETWGLKLKEAMTRSETTCWQANKGEKDENEMPHCAPLSNYSNLGYSCWYESPRRWKRTCGVHSYIKKDKMIDGKSVERCHI